MSEANRTVNKTIKYDDSSIQTLNPLEHIRRRPGMYIGSLGNGESREDGIYLLFKEVLDNSIDEFVMKAGDRIVVEMDDKKVHVRDYGRGIPQGKLVDCVSKINTGGKFDANGEVFKYSIGLNGVGLKAVNALSSRFEIRSYRDGKCVTAVFERGELKSKKNSKAADGDTGTEVFFTPDGSKGFFENYSFDFGIIEDMLTAYALLNKGLTVVFNGKSIKGRNGLQDMLDKKIGDRRRLYDTVHCVRKDGVVEFAFTHVDGSFQEEYYSYANGQYTLYGGTHQSFFKEALYKSLSGFFKKDWTQQDVREGIAAAISVKVKEPKFDSQTKSKLTNQEIRDDVMDFVRDGITDFLLKNSSVAQAIQDKITASEKMHREIQDIKKKSKEVQNRVRVNVPKLKDCIYHLTDRSKSNQEKAKNSMIFVCEGDSAATSFVKTRDPQYQAVFPLRGKVQNVEKKANRNVLLYNDRNAELYNMVTALGIENDIENLRYDKVIIATDADNDGYHIRLLLMTFFINYFPELVLTGRLYILETPLFKVRNKSSLEYCYTESERDSALRRIKGAEVTRFKGLGEVDAADFRKFIGDEMKLIPVSITSVSEVEKEVDFYMGNNTPERKDFIMENLV